MEDKDIDKDIDKDKDIDMNIDVKLVNGLSELFIREPSSLEIIIMLTDKGPMTINEISDEVVCGIGIADLLVRMKRFKIIGFINSLVYVTSYGQCIVRKMSGRMEDIRR